MSEATEQAKAELAALVFVGATPDASARAADLAAVLMRHCEGWKGHEAAAAASRAAAFVAICAALPGQEASVLLTLSRMLSAVHRMVHAKQADTHPPETDQVRH